MGHLTLIDDDRVSLSNLQRQVQFGTDDVAKDKIAAFAARLKAINPDCEVSGSRARLDAQNAEGLLQGHDLVLDGTDSFRTRFAVNAATHRLAIPLISGAVGLVDAQFGLFGAPDPCYRCLVPDIPPEEETCAEVGVLGALTGLAGSVMAMEAIKWITGAGETLAGRLWIYDGLTAQSRTVSIARDPACPVCG